MMTALTAFDRFDLVPMEPFGVRVSGLAVGELGWTEVARLLDALAEHGVVVMTDSRPEAADADERFWGLVTSLGEPMFTVGETPLDGFSMLNVISNVGRETTPVSNWHVDTSYVDQPPSYTMLRAVEVPEKGGATLFSDQFAAWDTLSDDLRSRVEGRTVRHVVTGVEPGEDQQHEAEHPLVRPHPRTGRPALYLTSAKRCASVRGLDDDDASALIDELIEHSTSAENVLEHRWRPGDVVVWDNNRVMHRADHSAVVGDRVMHRGMVAAR